MLETITVNKTVKKQLTSLTTGIISLFDSQSNLFENVVSKSIFIDRLSGLSKLPSLQATSIPNWRLNDNELNKQYRTLEFEFNSHRKQLNIYIGKNNEWQKIGMFSLVNPSNYPYRFFNLLDFISGGDIAKLQSGYTIGLEVENVGFGLLGEDDVISIQGSYTEQYILGNTDLVADQEPITIEDVIDLQELLDAKSSITHGHQIYEIVGLEAELAEKAIASEVQSALEQKLNEADLTNIQGQIDQKAPIDHGHQIYEIVGLEAELAEKAIASEVQSALEQIQKNYVSQAPPNSLDWTIWTELDANNEIVETWIRKAGQWRSLTIYKFDYFGPSAGISGTASYHIPLDDRYNYFFRDFFANALYTTGTVDSTNYFRALVTTQPSGTTFANSGALSNDSLTKKFAVNQQFNPAPGERLIYNPQKFGTAPNCKLAISLTYQLIRK